MSLRIATLLCTGLTAQAHSTDLHDAARGLDIHIEDMEGGVGVNGLSFDATRVVGPDASRVATRLIDRWRADSGLESVRVMQCCGWTIASRIHAGESQVIQWRPLNSGSELLWSGMRVTAQMTLPPQSGVPLLPECSWSTSVHGQVSRRQFIQHSARCETGARTALEAMARGLSSHGWKWQRRGPLQIQAEKGLVQAQVVAASATPDPRASNTAWSSLVVLESRPAEGNRP